MDYYENIINEEVQADRKYYEELPKFNHETYEPKRSRIQLDVSKATRTTIGKYATSIGMNPKQMILEALAEKYPQMAEEILAEIRRPNHPTYKHYTEVKHDK